MFKKVTLIACGVFFGIFELSAQIEVNSIASEITLANNANVQAVRATAKSTFEEVQNRTDWAQYHSTFGVSSGETIWLRFDAENQSAATVHSYLFSNIPNTIIYQQKNGGGETGANSYQIPTPISGTGFTKLSLTAFEKSRVFISLNESGLFQIPNNLSLFSESGYLELSQKEDQSQASSIAFVYFYIVSLFTIIIFAFVFWLKLSKKLYLYYLGYLVFQLAYGFIVLQTTLAPIGNFLENAPNLAKILFEPVQFVFIGFYIFFIIHLLRVKNYDRLLAVILTYLGAACFAYAVFRVVFSLFFYDPVLSGTFFAIARLIILPINFVLIFWIILKVKHPLLIYFIIGQSFFFAGALLGSYIGYYGIDPTSESIFNFKQAPNIIFQIGLLAEVYCFSLALGQNVFLLQKEKEKTNDELITQLQENQLLQQRMNRELDEKVHEKTEELIQLYTELEHEREQKIKDDFTQRIKETEMVALRSQMNPHFIFNSLSAIKHLIMTARNDDAISYLDDFSTLLREFLQNSNRKKITVEEELEILELYLSLEQNRMGTDFKYTIVVSSREELSQHQIPPILLQPLVENAIWHGLQPSLKREKKLNIIFDTSEDLKIIIEDNGIGRKESAKKKKLHNSMGTTIVHDRLTLYNHLNDHRILIKTTDLEDIGKNSGTRITLTYQY